MANRSISRSSALAPSWKALEERGASQKSRGEAVAASTYTVLASPNAE
jgi:hypothetical protein